MDQAKLKANPGDTLLVSWFDAWCEGSRTTDGKDIESATCNLYDVGFFIRTLDNYLVIAQEFDPESEDFRDIHYIPFVNIIKVDILLPRPL